MPPLVWREKIAICPQCWEVVDCNCNICPNCDAEFESPDYQIRKTVIPRNKAYDLWLAAFVSTSVLSIVFLITAAFLADLHRVIPPLHDNSLAYILLIFIVMALAIFLIVKYPRREVKNTRSWISRRFLIITILIMGAALVGFIAMAKEIDQIIASNGHYVVIMIMLLISGLAFLHIRIMEEKTKKRDYKM